MATISQLGKSTTFRHISAERPFTVADGSEHIRFDDSGRPYKFVNKNGHGKAIVNMSEEPFNTMSPKSWLTNLKTFSNEYVKCCESPPSDGKCLGSIIVEQDSIPTTPSPANFINK